jgi:phosphoesterase RecJ-like protein
LNTTSPGHGLSPEAEAIAGVIRDNQTFLIIGHIRPDGDCLGSCLGLMAALQALGKAVRMYTAGPVPAVMSYIAGIDSVETTLPDQSQFDAILCVDTADASRVHAGYEPPEHLYVIDHHISNTHFGKINWVDGTAAAAAEMIYRLIGALGVDITPQIATALFTGIATDTGSFRFSNTNEATFRVAADLVSRGANAAQIAERVWSSRKPSAVKLAALVLSTINYEFDGRLAWNEVTLQMLQQAGGDEAELEGLSGEMRAIEGVQVAVLFTETETGECRIGFRSKGQVNVSTLAQLLGGGGHKNASGASLAEDYLLARHRALQVIREHLAAQFSASA